MKDFEYLESKTLKELGKALAISLKLRRGFLLTKFRKRF